MTKVDMSIVIPVFNEEALLRSTLDSLARNLATVSAEVVVACNGCIDRSVDIAKDHSLKCTVLDISKPSKTGAMNAADAIMDVFPRVYLDADVQLSDDALQLVRDKFLSGKVDFIALDNHTSYVDSSSLVRRYYRFWQSLPYVKSEGVGSGFFAMSEAGRERFGKFPDVIADDEYVRRFFEVDEIALLTSAFTEVRAPLTLISFIRTKVRGRVGAYELAKKFPRLERARQPGRFYPILTNLFNSMGGCADAIVYIGLTAIIRVLALINHKLAKNTAWYQDKSGRSV